MLEEVLTESGYFDQGHFIKEVRDFSSKTSDDFFNVTPCQQKNLLLLLSNLQYAGCILTVHAVELTVC